uniref:Uncharacterized protein n=1 Tax=Halamphora americana TaxID=2305497 RepID=A0A516ZB53_9STRA|nr:hypothetical protein [Halamphora americana]QDR24928.1 hypothetical protein [Halamphora americana]
MTDYFDIPPTPFNNLMDTTNGILSQVPTLANSALLVDSTCTTGRAAMNFCCANNIVSRTCFVTSCICGTVGVVASGTAIATSFFGIPAAGAIGTLGARAFNRLGKYTLTLGNFTNANEISELIN